MHNVLAYSRPTKRPTPKGDETEVEKKGAKAQYQSSECMILKKPGMAAKSKCTMY